MDLIATKLVGSTLTVYIKCDIDHHVAKRLREAIDLEIGSSKAATVILDFSGVGFMDSSGVGLIMGRHKLLARSGGELKLQKLSPSCQKLLELSGILEIFGF